MAWQNWARNQRCDPIAVRRSKQAGEIVAAVQQAASDGRTVRAVGTGHSFSPVAVTDGVMIDLSAFTGLVRVDRERQRVRFRAGTPLHQANRLLDGLGLAFTNLGDIDRQTVAGAISTGTHGTGGRYSGLCAAVTGLQLVLADGSLVECSADERPALFEAARLSLGAIGVITEVEFACVPAFRMLATERGAPLAEVLAGIEQWLLEVDHVEFYWFPYTAMTQVKLNERLAPDDDRRIPLPGWRRVFDDEFCANGLFGLGNEVCARTPGFARTFNRISAWGIADRTFTSSSHEAFVSPRRVRFLETEQAVPVECFAECFAEIRCWFERHNRPVTVPLEVRFAAADDVWLSTAYRRDTAYIAAHAYPRADVGGYLTDVEAICRDFGARPHWGKINELDLARVQELYPRLADFAAVRDEVDRDRRFANALTRHQLGV